MKQQVMQEVENAIVEQVLDSMAAVAITPLQRVELAGVLAHNLIDALAPYMRQPDAPAAPERVVRKRGPRKPKQTVVAGRIVNEVTPAQAQVVPSAPDVQPAPFKGPPAAAQPFSA